MEEKFINKCIRNCLQLLKKKYSSEYVFKKEIIFDIMYASSTSGFVKGD
ncbi:MAG: hypothetical protein RHS_4505 [Robinsoniella sp. RHS]|nr:MAG: hypothetical protein RHS_4505 [Robinsoniella sp. RHS]